MLNIVKKEEPSKKRELATRLLAVVAALGATAIIMAFLGLNPFEVYAKMIEGATGTAYRFQETINKTIPLVILSLGIAVAFKMKFWNIGAEGQFYMGAFGAAWVAFSFPEAPAAFADPRDAAGRLFMRRPVGVIPARSKQNGTRAKRW